LTGSSPTGGAASAIAAAQFEGGRGSLARQLGLLGALGVAAAALQTWARLRLGVPGHSAMLWLTPIIVGRCLVPRKAAGTVCSTVTAVGLYAFGGFSLRWPVVLSFGTYWLVGPALDFYVSLIEAVSSSLGRKDYRFPGRLAVIVLPVAGVVGNYAALFSKVLFQVIRPHRARFGIAPGVYEIVTYLVFGLVAGSLAYVATRPFPGRKTENA